jgi:hypothetical protein
MRPERRPTLALVLAALTLLALPPAALAATYEVGPGQPYPTLQAVADALGPGDVVNVHPGTYAGGVVLERDGAPGNPITVRGVGTSRPQLQGGTNTIEVAGDHHVVERLDLSGGSSRCFYHHAHDVVLRDTLIHDCPGHGLLGADNDSGTLLAERIEVVRSGEGQYEHPIYMATDETTHPGAVFRLRHSLVREVAGGNAIKSRAERNEIHYNWIESGPYHALELIGPDPAGGSSEGLRREDSDVVGNVLVGGPFGALVRVGGDATGQSHGRYRFAFNTMLASPSTSVVFRAFDAIDSIEAHGNVITGGDEDGTIVREAEAEWQTDPRGVGGDRNWVHDRWALPPEWTNTLRGADPGFEPGGVPQPAAGSPLIDAGPASTVSPAGHDFPAPLFPPAENPGVGGGSRPANGPLDIGAFEWPPAGGPADGGPGGAPPPPGSAPGGPGPGGGPASPTGSRRLALRTRLRLRCRRRCRITVVLRRGSALVARRTLRLRPRRAVRLRVTLTRRGEALLRRSGRLRVRATIVVRPRGRPARRRIRTLLLRLP